MSQHIKKLCFMIALNVKAKRDLEKFQRAITTDKCCLSFAFCLSSHHNRLSFYVCFSKSILEISVSLSRIL